MDMHTRELRAAGETEQRLYLLSVWRECPFYTARECAALAWTEALTLLQDGDVPDDIYSRAREQFSEEQLVNSRSRLLRSTAPIASTLHFGPFPVITGFAAKNDSLDQVPRSISSRNNSSSIQRSSIALRDFCAVASFSVRATKPAGSRAYSPASVNAH
jgi:carboxymuconolactone decarboxylase family protein